MALGIPGAGAHTASGGVKGAGAPSHFVPVRHASGSGYWLLGNDGGVFSFGNAAYRGSMAGTPLAAPTVCMASTKDAGGYWLVGSDGGVFSFGDAGFQGSLAGKPLAAPIVGMAETPDGSGYWLVGSDGGVFSFGDASYFGGMAGKPLAAPIVGMAALPNGSGYWLVGSDGGVFSFGDAFYFGGMAGKPLAAPIVGMAADPDGYGYWLVGSDGGVFSFGAASFKGSMAGTPLAGAVIGISPTTDGGGYWLAGADGGGFSLGDASYKGSMAGKPLAAPVAAIAGLGESGGCLGSAVPADLTPVGGGGPAGEGHWVPDGRLVGSTTAVYTTVMRPYVGGPTAGIAWVDMSRCSLRLYAGPPSQPAGNFIHAGQVAVSDRPRLLSAFNAGFQMADSNGGWYSEGQMPVSLRDGAASLVIRADGRAYVGMWGRDFAMSPEIASVRQNLNLLVDGGQPASNLWVGAWGAVLSGDGPSGDWRSGIGTDRYGNLIYVGGPRLLPGDLAHLLIAAGSIEGMELDINPEWVTFSSYTTSPGQSDPANLTGWNLIGGMYFGPSRFITSTNRDFFAVLAR